MVYFIDHVLPQTQRRSGAVGALVQHLVTTDPSLNRLVANFQQDYFSLQSGDNDFSPNWSGEWLPDESVLEAMQGNFRERGTSIRKALAFERDLDKLIKRFEQAQLPTRYERMLNSDGDPEPGE
jgi:hypothetical protein